MSTRVVIIVMISTGEEIIGEAQLIEDSNGSALTITNPMFIVDTADGMRLRDALLLSDNTKLTFKSEDVITYYKPTELLVEYYDKAVEYSSKYTKKSTRIQLAKAVSDIDSMLNDQSSTKIFATGSNKIH